MGAGGSAGATGGLSLSHGGEETPSSIALSKMFLSLPVLRVHKAHSGLDHQAGHIQLF